MKAGHFGIMALLVTVALAGCADDPPSGEFTLGSPAVLATGTVEIFIQQFEDPVGLPDPLTCSQNSVPGGEAEYCVDPYTNFTVHFHGTDLSEAGSAGYALHWVDETGLAMPLGELPMTNGMYTGNYTVDEDLTGRITEVRLVSGDLIVATATGNSGPNNFAPASDLRVTGSGSYSGKSLTIKVEGMPDNTTLKGWLVTVDENGVKDHAEDFTVTAGENTYDAEMNIVDYAEIHIHAGDSKINLSVTSTASA